MSERIAAPWHAASYERFVGETLPALLAERLPLPEYRAVPGEGRYRVTVGLAAGVAADYDLPRPDAQGLFTFGPCRRIVPAVADDADLAVARIACVGERLLADVAGWLGQAPEGLPWDEALLRAWLPLDTRVREFLLTTADYLDETNWLATQTHLRRLWLDVPAPPVTHPSQAGRVCPFETPEGPNLGRVLHLARGAAIEDGRLVIRDASPVAALGWSASWIPLLAHDDPNRLLMGANLQRMWPTPPTTEPALVQSGLEPDEPAAWCGRNLLTAFVAWGLGTYEDGLVLSESAAARLGYPRPLACGDWLGNRHGTKATVSVILPDAAMPQLPDGRTVELVFGFIGCHTRLNHGQLLEAVLGRLAMAEGQPVVAPPYGSEPAAWRARLAAAGLPESGMEVLRRAGQPLARPSTVGWVYWGKLYHRAEDKLRCGPDDAQRIGELEHAVLRDVGASGLRAECHALRDVPAEALRARLAAGDPALPAPPAPKFAALVERLAVAGIQARLEGERVAFAFAPPADGLRLACGVPHPWLRERALEVVGAAPERPEWPALVAANERVARLLAGDAPAALREPAVAQLAAAVAALLDALVTPEQVRFGNRVALSGRATLAVGEALSPDQVELPAAMAEALFGPLARGESLAAVLARSWVVLTRAPAVLSTSLLAFRPVLGEAFVVRVHPFVCPLLNADFDGDQVAVLAPLTAAGRREAAERLSLAGHLRHDPELLRWLLPAHEALWGLSWLSRTPAGRAVVAERLGEPVAAPEGYLTRTTLLAAARAVLAREGVEVVLARLDALMRLGFAEAQASGASLSPFPAEGLPADDEPELAERLAAWRDFDAPALGPQVLAVKAGARGSLHTLTTLVGPRGEVTDAAGRPVMVRRSLAAGLTPEEMTAVVAPARAGLAQVVAATLEAGYGARRAAEPQAFTPLARAVRAPRPGLAFAQAAALGEVDPLVDPDSRLFVGLVP